MFLLCSCADCLWHDDKIHQLLWNTYTLFIPAQQYLIDHSYGNAETSELWEALDQQVLLNCFSPQAFSSLILMVGCTVSHPQAGNNRDVHVTQMMDTWTKQMGYPVLTVSKSANNLSQTRFFAVTPEDKNTIPLSPYKWEPLDTAPMILWLRVTVTASPWQISFARCWYIYLCFSLSLSPVSIAYSMHTQLESEEAWKWGYHLLPPLFLCCCAQSSSKLLLPLCMWLLHSFAPGFINIVTMLPIPTSLQRGSL